MAADPIPLLQKLIRCESVTPREGGALTLLEQMLGDAGFLCTRLKFSDKDTPDVDNLYARFGTASPHLCFAGHVDTVPAGPEGAWTVGPFEGIVKDGKVWGRGAVDMKGAIAAFAAVALELVKEGKIWGSISFLLTGDEEGPAINGTRKMLEWVEKNGEAIDFCVLGEPTTVDVVGDTVKIGRRGSLNGKLSVTGRQGHVAYPQSAENPIPGMVKLVAALKGLELDKGSAHFDPSNLEFVSLESGVAAENIIPGKALAGFNVRFNDHWTGASLEKKLRETMNATGVPYELKTRLSGESFYTPPGPLYRLVEDAVRRVTSLTPAISTSGGISDARFIRKYCPVVELGLPNRTAHQADERVDVDDVKTLANIYREIILAYCK